jgi:hypothetical protein
MCCVFLTKEPIMPINTTRLFCSVLIPSLLGLSTLACSDHKDRPAPRAERGYYEGRQAGDVLPPQSGRYSRENSYRDYYRDRDYDRGTYRDNDRRDGRDPDRDGGYNNRDNKPNFGDDRYYGPRN